MNRKYDEFEIERLQECVSRIKFAETREEVISMYRGLFADFRNGFLNNMAGIEGTVSIIKVKLNQCQNPPEKLDKYIKYIDSFLERSIKQNITRTYFHFGRTSPNLQIQRNM